jgi:hypothetical protein
MILIVTSRISSNCHQFRQRASRSLLLVPLIGCVLACASCAEQGPPMVDLNPLAAALRTIAFAVVAVGVLGVIAKIIK